MSLFDLWNMHMRPLDLIAVFTIFLRVLILLTYRCYHLLKYEVDYIESIQECSHRGLHIVIPT